MAERGAGRSRRVLLQVSAALGLALAGCDLRQYTRDAGRQAAPPADTTPSPGRLPTPVAGAEAGRAAVPHAGLDTVRVVREARPAVVHIATSVVALNQLRRAVEVPAGVGTGVIFGTFNAGGYLITNSHVVRGTRGGPADRIVVTLPDDRSVEARVLDDDPLNDLAILRIEAPDLRAARIGDSDRLRVGEPVVAIGHALALPGGPTVSTGVVSALGRSIEAPNGITLPNLIQTDAAINPGNSGGPLLNANAEVIGINTAGIAEAQGIAFAVAINQAKGAMESVIATGRVARPYLGVEIVGAITPAIARANGLPAERGVVVRVPDPSSPAGRAGLQNGDIVVAADGQPVRSAPELLAAIRRHKPGESLRLQVVRAQGAPVEIVATLTERPGTGQ